MFMMVRCGKRSGIVRQPLRTGMSKSHCTSKGKEGDDRLHLYIYPPFLPPLMDTATGTCKFQPSMCTNNFVKHYHQILHAL